MINLALCSVPSLVIKNNLHTETITSSLVRPREQQGRRLF